MSLPSSEAFPVGEPLVHSEPSTGVHPSAPFPGLTQWHPDGGRSGDSGKVESVGSTVGVFHSSGSFTHVRAYPSTPYVDSGSSTGHWRGPGFWTLSSGPGRVWSPDLVVRRDTDALVDFSSCSRQGDEQTS